MDNKLELLHQIQDQRNSLDHCKDLLNEAIIENRRNNLSVYEDIVDELLCQNLNLHGIGTLHKTLMEMNPASSLLAIQLQIVTQNVKGMYEQQYYYYLQKTCQIHDLYQGIKLGTMEKFENLQVFIITAHKVQNISNVGFQIMNLFYPNMEYQKDILELIYYDIVSYNEFTINQLELSLDEYATQSSSIILSLYQIYTDCLLQNAELCDISRSFSQLKLKQPKKMIIAEQILVDFLSLSSQLMLVDATTLRPLNIPTKLLPCGGDEERVIRYYRKFHSIG